MELENRRRWNVLHDLLCNKEHKVGAEIGVQIGLMAKNILGSLPSIEKYYAIDPWLDYDGYCEGFRSKKLTRVPQPQMDHSFKTFIKDTEQYKDRIVLLKMFSSEAVKYIEDGSLDWIFIDGNHSYESLKEDIELYLPKIKKDGLISGHDYGLQLSGVKEAVQEKFLEFSTGSNSMWWKIV